MNDAIDQLLGARFEAVADQTDDSDWRDVLVRARSAEAVPPKARIPGVWRGGRATARFALAAAVVVAALAASAAAFGWPGSVVDFFKARPAPASIKQFFSSHNAGLPAGQNPNTGLGQPREVMTATFDANNVSATDPTLHTLYVAPRDGGGFCYLWTDAGGGCADPENAALGKTNPAARPLGVEWFAGDYATFTDGWTRSDVKTVEARFADGTKVALPVTSVSAPINAGFFAYVVPSAHQTTSDALSSVVGLDLNGNVVGQADIGVTQPLDQDVLQTLPDGTKYSLPRRAQAAQAREVVNFDTTNGAHIYLWVMPRTGGGNCFLYTNGAGGGGGCTSPSWLSRSPLVTGGGLMGSPTDPVYFAEVSPDVATLELRYANGASERLTPVDGFVLHEIPAAQVEPSARLVAVVELDRNGNALDTQNLGRWNPVFIPGGANPRR